MNFKEWHNKQLSGDPDTCPHKDWEKVAWNAAIDEAIKLKRKYDFSAGEVNSRHFIEQLEGLK